MTEGLTPEGQKIVDGIADRHGFSGAAAVAVLRALAIGNGTQAQFDHPELGGMGQWSQGGMMMIGDMFNQSLKARVDGLCRDLAEALRSQPVFAPDERFAPAQGYDASGASVSLFAQGFDSPSRTWWPDGLGHAASAGSQNNLHYAYFPSSRRLAIKQDGRVSVYDSGDHRISGVSQQQSGDQSLTFTSQHGVVRLGDLKVVSSGAGDRPAQSRQSAGAPATQPAAPPSFTQSDLQSRAAATATPAAEILSTIEKLADLRQKNILSEAEFAAKKAELLARL